MSKDPTKELLKFAIKASDGNDVTSNVNLRSEEDKEFLKSAISHFASSQNLTDQLISLVRQLKELLTAGEYIQAGEVFEMVSELCENIDVACDMHKIGGFDVISLGLSTNDLVVQSWSASTIGTCAQNNPYCQEKLVEGGFLNRLLELTENDNNVGVKAVFAISCIIRQNDKALEKFINLNGFDYISRCLSKSSERMQMKAIFLIQSVCVSSPTCHQHVSNKNVINKLIELLLQTSNDDMINSLLTIVLNLATHNKSVITILASFGNGLKEKLENFEKNPDFDNDVKKNCQFILHLLSKITI